MRQTLPYFTLVVYDAGTIEEKIYARQIVKDSVTSGVCDDEQLARSFSKSELDDLWSLSDPPPFPDKSQLNDPVGRFPVAATDRILRRVLSSDAGRWVSGLIGHDSLLVADEVLDRALASNAACHARLERRLPRSPRTPSATRTQELDLSAEERAAGIEAFQAERSAEHEAMERVKQMAKEDCERRQAERLAAAAANGAAVPQCNIPSV